MNTAENLPAEIAETSSRIFEIPVENMRSLEENMKKLQRRAKRLGVANLGFEVLGRYVKDVTRVERDGTTRKLKVQYATVEVFGPVVAYEGWNFVGKLDFVSAKGATLRLMLDGEDCPDWVKEIPATRCDHCNTARRRNTLYILRHEDGRETVVGSNCAKDFLGDATPDKVAKIAALLFDANYCASEGERWDGGSSEPDTFDPTTVLAYSFACVRTDGWAPSRSDNATKDDVLFMLAPPTGYGPHERYEIEKAHKVAMAKVTQKDWDKASAAIEWISNLDTGSSDYLHNLQAVLSNYVTWKTMGIAASGAIAYDRDVAKRVVQTKGDIVSEKKALSTFVGEIKDRLDLDLTVGMVRYLDSDWGVTTMIHFTDDSGNKFVWFASGGVDVEEGDRVALRGTVKKHEIFRDEKQTHLTRCKFTKTK